MTRVPVTGVLDMIIQPAKVAARGATTRGPLLTEDSADLRNALAIDRW
jgi:hypothetical protein